MQHDQATEGSERFHEYELPKFRAVPARKNPMAHQATALEKLTSWYRTSGPEPRGALLVLPTGGGKTFTAVRFLCSHPLADGFKVLWLAHTHHLLEQAQGAFIDSAGFVSEPKETLRVRVVSGAVGAFKTAHIKTSDDVVIGSLQSIAKAMNGERLESLSAFIKSACGRLLVVFDEAHHAPAPSYRRLLLQLREACPSVIFLGLTATPMHSDERKAGWFLKLFPQAIIHQADAKALMAAGVLSKPILEEAPTDFSPPPMSENEYSRWLNTNQDLPESVIKVLAESRERNEKIANHYAANKKKYGKTIIFADRVAQCIALCEVLKKRGVRADAVYSQVNFDNSTPEERNKRTSDDNAQVLEAFKRGDLDVLVNVRMLTEGTDVPKVETVFLTRQTTSQSLLVQMVGRGMRGPAVGGTENVHLVFFIDDWKQRIQWADYAQIQESETGPDPDPSVKRPPIQLISVELIRRLARAIDSGSEGTAASFLSFLPCGWFNVEFDDTAPGSENTETINRMILAYDHDKPHFDKFISALTAQKLSGFEESEINHLAISETLEAWQRQFFDSIEQQIGSSLPSDVLALARHVAQNDYQAPKFFPFEDRQKHDLDRLAEKAITDNLGPVATEKLLRDEFANAEFYWKALFTRFEQFRTQFNLSRDHLIDVIGGRAKMPAPGPKRTEPQPPEEPRSEVKDRIYRRDGNSCVCCGANRLLQVDHIKSRFRGGGNEETNLQLLCKVCNGLKGTDEIDFRAEKCPLSFPPTKLPPFELRDLLDGGDLGAGRERLLRRWINFFYRSSAVDQIEAVHKDGKLRTTKIKLKPGLDRSWIRPHLQETIRIINSDAAVDETSPVSAVTLGESPDGTARPEIGNGPRTAHETEHPPETKQDDRESAEDEGTPNGDTVTIREVLESIFEVEGFRVQVLGREGRRIKGNWARGIEQYPYQNKLNEAKTVNAWKTTRFLPCYEVFDGPDYMVEVLDSDGNPCAGNTKLRTVRESYA